MVRRQLSAQQTVDDDGKYLNFSCGGAEMALISLIPKNKQRERITSKGIVISVDSQKIKSRTLLLLGIGEMSSRAQTFVSLVERLHFRFKLRFNQHWSMGFV